MVKGKEQIYTKLLWDFNKKYFNKPKEKKVKQLKVNNNLFTAIEEIESISSLADIHDKTFDISSHSTQWKNMFFTHIKELINRTPITSKIRLFLTVKNNTTGEEKEIPLSLNPTNIDIFDSIVKNSGIYTEIVKNSPEASEYLDLNENMEVKSIRFIDLEQLEQYRTNKLREGKFFPYLLTSSMFDLSMYQIYSRAEDIDYTNCFVYSLMMSKQVDSSIIEALKNDIQTQYITLKGIEYYSKKYKLNIKLEIYYKNSRNKFLYYNFNEGKPISILLYKKHLMINKPMKINFNYFRYKDDEQLKSFEMEKQLLVKRRNREKLYDFHNQIPEKYPVSMLPLLFRNGAFKKITFKELKPKESSSEVLPVAINSFDFKPVCHFSPFDEIENLFMVGGEFYANIRQTLYGARVWLNPNCKHIKEPIVDLDVHSLYPYAMTKLGVPIGFPILSHSYLETGPTFYSYNLIRVLEIRETFFPLLPKPLIVGKTYWLNGIDLDELITRAHLKFEYIVGYYFKTIDYSFHNYIYKLYEERKLNSSLKFKLNSLYGMCLRKQVNTVEKHFPTLKQLNKYVYRNWNQIIKYDENKLTVEELKKYNNHYNLAHFGVLIPSMARKLMNEYIFKLGDKLIYSDTDSILLRKKDFDSTMFKIGNEIGDWHYDLPNNLEYAVEGIFLARKRYLLVLPNGEYKIVFNGKRSSDIREPKKYFKALLEKKDKLF